LAISYEWKVREKEEREQLLRKVEQLSVEEQFERFGDRHPDFKYTL
jgi:hypothetical protein